MDKQFEGSLVGVVAETEAGALIRWARPGGRLGWWDNGAVDGTGPVSGLRSEFPVGPSPRTLLCVLLGARHFPILSALSRGSLKHPTRTIPHKPPLLQASSLKPQSPSSHPHRSPASWSSSHSLPIALYPDSISPLSPPPRESSSHASVSLLTRRRIDSTDRHCHSSTPTATLDISASAIQCSPGYLCRNEPNLPTSMQSSCGSSCSSR